MMLGPNEIVVDSFAGGGEKWWPWVWCDACLSSGTTRDGAAACPWCAGRGKLPVPLVHAQFASAQEEAA